MFVWYSYLFKNYPWVVFWLRFLFPSRVAWTLTHFGRLGVDGTRLPQGKKLTVTSWKWWGNRPFNWILGPKTRMSRGNLMDDFIDLPNSFGDLQPTNLQVWRQLIEESGQETLRNYVTFGKLQLYMSRMPIPRRTSLDHSITSSTRSVNLRWRRVSMVLNFSYPPTNHMISKHTLPTGDTFSHAGFSTALSRLRKEKEQNIKSSPYEPQNLKIDFCHSDQKCSSVERFRDP